ncbi:MAG: hypothetical protein NTW19_20840, partial [Planctomycetota bacterium]|nr:hypothetical protein [Planctomycetota bacterium]
MTRPPSRLLAVAISLASCLLFPAIAFAGAVKPAETRPAARPAAPVPAVRPVALPTELALPGILSSDMVLQRGMPVPIWGVAAPDEKVTVTFRDQTKTAVADKDGKWSLKLDPLAPGEPATLTVAGKKRLTLTGVLVGDVWVGSGQSNMQMAVIGAAKGDKVLDALAAKDYPQIRLASATGHWREATAANNGKFSAILFSFGVPLQKELNVPIGLVVGAVGGTPSGRWLTREMFLADPDARKAAGWLPIDATPEEVELAENAHEATYQRALVNYKIDLAKWEAAHPAPPATAPASAPATAARPP